jgi:cytoskeletal protein CcmA (bactofilin family)
MFSGKQTRLEMIIGPESMVKGDLISKGTIKIDGQLEGNVTADTVIIGEKGLITGDATVKGMVIGGRIAGNVRASESVEIQQKGVVNGDVFSSKLTIAEGAIFDGRSVMQRSKEITYNGSGPEVVIES